MGSCMQKLIEYFESFIPIKVDEKQMKSAVRYIPKHQISSRGFIGIAFKIEYLTVGLKKVF